MKIVPLTIQCTPWLLDQQNITWMIEFQYFHNLYVLWSTADKPETCKWLELTRTSSYLRVRVWTLHGINCMYMCLCLTCYQPIHVKNEETARYAGAHYNHLCILCINVTVIYLTFASSFNANHSICSSAYIIIACPTNYSPHLIFFGEKWLLMQDFWKL